MPDHNVIVRTGEQAPGLTILQRGPDNLEPAFSSASESFVTSAERFYVRTHFEVPRIEASLWRIAIEGEVDRPFEIDLEELNGMPSETRMALLECSGNGRIYLDQIQIGIRWGLGGVGNAEWTGVPLVALLERAGVKPGAVEVILEGADEGEFLPPQHETPGRIRYARSLPLKKARKNEVLLAYRMNGEELAPRHGYPVRAVVPGWYGMASVKWLRRIIVTDRPFHGFFQTMEYAVWERRHGLPTLVPVSEIQVKAQIARPAPHEIVPRGKSYRIRGAAWAGESDVARVEISDDGGRSWSDASLLGDPIRYAWRFWEHEWHAPEAPGPRVLMVRATDFRGLTQPMERDTDLRDAAISHALPIEVQVC